MSRFPRPKKMFGQNFLSDPSILSRMADEAEITPGDRVLEVGPGRGALTRLLLERGATLVSVEIDRELVRLLSEDLSGHPRFSLIGGDILSLDIPALCPSGDGALWKVVANLPYNISTPFLFRLVEQRGHFGRIVVMLQREVGERLAARSGGAEYGALSVIFQSHFSVRRAFAVKPGSFHPRPSVDSVVLVITPLTVEPDVGDRNLFERLVKGAFSTRRKTLLNALRGVGGFSDQLLASCFEAADIDPARRGETLSLEEFAALSRAATRHLENSGTI